MTSQLGLFCRQQFTMRDRWRYCWNWDGPEVGGYCEVGQICAELESSPGQTVYCYMEQCKIIGLRNDGRWLVEIDMGLVHGNPWPKDGTRLVLSEDEIWAPTRKLRAQRIGRDA
jgi:hypothetical protein